MKLLKMNQGESALIQALYYLDDATLMAACQSNSKIYFRVCRNIWISRIVNKFGLDINEIERYRQGRTYGEYYFYLLNLSNISDPNILHPIIERAILDNRLDIVKVGLTVFPRVAELDSDVLRNAIDSGHAEMVKLLLENGANVHLDDDIMLFSAILNKEHSMELVILLLKAGATVNQIHIRTAEKYRPEVLELLKSYQNN